MGGAMILRGVIMLGLLYNQNTNISSVRLGPLNSQFSHITNIVCESRKLLRVILLGYFKCLGLQVSRAFFEPDVGPVRPLAWHTRGSYDLVHPQTQS